MNDIHSLSHSKWNCKYHIVFAPKYRRKVFYGTKRLEIGQILRQLCNWYGVTLLEAEVCPDHIHMLVEIPPKQRINVHYLPVWSLGVKGWQFSIFIEPIVAIQICAKAVVCGGVLSIIFAIILLSAEDTASLKISLSP